MVQNKLTKSTCHCGKQASRLILVQMSLHFYACYSQWQCTLCNLEKNLKCNKNHLGQCGASERPTQLFYVRYNLPHLQGSLFFITAPLILERTRGLYIWRTRAHWSLVRNWDFHFYGLTKLKLLELFVKGLFNVINLINSIVLIICSCI